MLQVIEIHTTPSVLILLVCVFFSALWQGLIHSLDVVAAADDDGLF